MKKSWRKALTVICCVVAWWTAGWGVMTILDRTNSKWKYAYIDWFLGLTAVAFVAAVVILSIRKTNRDRGL